MMLTKCYCVVYHVADFSKDGESTLHEDPYRIYSNALAVAKELTKCLDVVDGNVCIVSGLTGEVLVEFSADETVASTVEENSNAATKENAVEEEENSTSTDGFDDGTGGMWYLTLDGEWDYECLGLVCSHCAYCDENHCVVRSPATKKERDIQIKSARKRMRK